ncbi:hypothetical protein HNR26_000842 [Rhizobium rosettiformans]|uniref:Uncharacterized protein n=2 Tax=Rhizobium rosettiformans TaxID=1368430 RepID=A0A4S8QFF9_9HYPH|nr:hypothetical protein [Rhizobium rosettiformans]THV39354.1 hypothetical protein FAA86_03045 [Rhizobium rosettiformans W3]
MRNSVALVGKMPLTLTLSPQAGRGDGQRGAARPFSPSQRGEGAGRRMRGKAAGVVNAGNALPTSPLRGEVAAKRRVGVNLTTSSTSLINAQVSHITPPRSFAPTLPLKGRVSGTAGVESTP